MYSHKSPPPPPPPPPGERPNLLNGKCINIAKQISTKYFLFGVLLLNDETGAEVDTVITKCNGDTEQINIEILKLWIEGKGNCKPLSWDELIDVLKAVGLGTLAGDIHDGIHDQH